MVFRFLIIAFFLSVSHAYTAELCMNCHKTHYTGFGSCKGCHRGNPATARKDLAHKGVIRGKYARFMTLGEPQKMALDGRLNPLGCRRCHTIGNRGNPFATDLDQSAGKRSPDELADAIRSPVKAMPDFRLDEGSIDGVVTALLAASHRSYPNRKQAPLLVHFDTAAARKEDVFSRKCGGCHMALTRRSGVLGRSDAAPNLSGLFSPFYPAKDPWNAARLEKWLQNPRKYKTSAAMQPVELSPAEQLELFRLIGQDAIK